MARVWPALRMLRSSSLSFAKVSASSISNTGWYSSMQRYNAAGLMFDVGNGLCTSSRSTVRRVVLPQP